jgi:hypothetical protein
MKRSRECPECHGTVIPFKRGQDPDAALIQHVILSHPSVKMTISLNDLPTTTQEQMQ